METPSSTEDNKEIEKEKLTAIEFEQKVFDTHADSLKETSGIPQPRAFQSGSVKIMIY
jgi:hypothetical protein